MSQIVTLSLFRFDRLRDRLWAFAMMGAGRLSLGRTPDIGFWKLCGSGTGEGFTPIPNFGVYAILATWPDLETAKARIASAQIYQRYRNRAEEDWTVFLSPTSARGAWSGVSPFNVQSTNEAGPLAALTRATVKPRIAAQFWRRVPDISSVIGADTNVAFKIGIGEVPLLHQVTFSIWPDAQRMANFARTGHHAEAIRAVRDNNWFREELYARFSIRSDFGTWNGTSPLSGLDLP
ncbi:MAG: spheroidene monooxygenase [Pseudomonadota bacterium]